MLTYWLMRVSVGECDAVLLVSESEGGRVILSYWLVRVRVCKCGALSYWLVRVRVGERCCPIG